jgi:Protein of unknown function (DUF2938)
MNLSSEDIARVAVIGVGATAMMDRWVGHWRRGVFAHEEIAKAHAVSGELAVGWLFHYAIGVALAVLLVAIEGVEWTRAPSLLPALGVGMATVAGPWLVMQPAMGAGLAASRTPSPFKNGARSLANHAIFGLGLYLTAVLLAWVSQ